MRRWRKRVVFTGVLLAVAGIMAVVAATLYATWRLTLRAEEERLMVSAERLLVRATKSADMAAGALRAIDAAGLPPCSTAHVARMRQLTVNTRTVEEIGYFDTEGLLKCTSWGPVEMRVEREAPDYTRADGIEVALKVTPKVSQGRDMVTMHYGRHNVLINPERLVDLIADPDLSLAVVDERGILVNEHYMSAAARALLPGIRARPRSGRDGDTLYALAEGRGWIAIATEPISNVMQRQWTKQALMLPVGTTLVALVVGLSIWRSRRQLSPSADIVRGLRAREFFVHYQPLIDLRTGGCVGAEALVRWRREDGQVGPDLFIPDAEEHGLIQALTDQVIEAVVSEMSGALRADRALHIAINLCADDIRSGRVLPVIERLLAGTGIEPQQIWLEATERGFMEVGRARVTIQEARARGYFVAIDDFGTGFSSLQYLQGLPLDALKIDKSFIDAMGQDRATSSVVPHIIGMARTLKLVIVAEGIETQAQADYLREQGVEYGQGWLFAKALPAAEFIAFLKARA